MAEQRIWGLVAEFENPATLLHAATGLREAGYKRYEVWSPFPVHGMDGAMGLKRSLVPWIVLGGGLTGMTAALLLQWWTGAVDYPVMIGGKPLFSFEFATPVTFELSVLLSAFGAVFGMIGLNKLPQPFHPLDTVPMFRRVTDDALFISIEVRDPNFNLLKSRELLESLGGRHVTVVEEGEA
jgi:hypothetical protein